MPATKTPSFSSSYNFDELSNIVSQGNIKELKNAKGIELVNGDFKTLLHVSAQEKQLEIAKYLLEKGLNPNQKDAKGKSPFAYACLSEDHNLIKLFLDYKANVNTQDRLGNTPLHKAVKNISVLKVLLENQANPYIKNEFGLPVLHTAKNLPDTVDFLLKSKVNPNSMNEDGQSLLHTAAAENKIELAKKLLKYNAEVNFKDNNNNTPLFFAKTPEMAQELIINGAKVNIQNKENESPISIFFKNKNIKNLELILKNKGNPDEIIHGKTLLYHTNDSKIAKMLLDAGANPNNDYYLHYSLLMKNEELFDLFLSYNIDTNKKAENGRTPLFYCTNETELKKLINKNADVNIKDNKGNTAMHNFMLIGRKDLAYFLKKNGADEYARNNKGETPKALYEKWEKYNSWIK